MYYECEGIFVTIACFLEAASGSNLSDLAIYDLRVNKFSGDSVLPYAYSFPSLYLQIWLILVHYYRIAYEGLWDPMLANGKIKWRRMFTFLDQLILAMRSVHSRCIIQ